jgi:ABC-type multidrug transport system permease subunit
MKSTRSEAPYLPSNIEYIANNNALEGKEDVSYLHGSTEAGISYALLCVAAAAAVALAWTAAVLSSDPSTNR